MSSPKSPHSYTTYRTQSGYILVLTIAALALLGLAGAFIGQRISTSLRLAAAEQDYVREEHFAYDAMAKYIQLIATTQHAPTGLGSQSIAIQMDGRWYDANQGMAVSFRDGRGLINLRTSPRDWQERLLSTYGIPTEKIGMLLDALEDYTDKDSLRRLQGAEAEDYIRKGMLPPKNLPLSIKEELLRVYGWKEENTLWETEDNLLDNITIDDSTGMNPATATWRTMVAALDIPAETAKNFIAERTKLSTAGVAELSARYATTVTNENLYSLNKVVVYPSTTTVITIASTKTKRAWRTTLTLTPDEENHAWQMPDMMEISLKQPPKVEALQKLPDMTPFKVNIDAELKKMPF